MSSDGNEIGGGLRRQKEVMKLKREEIRKVMSEWASERVGGGKWWGESEVPPLI